MTESPLPFVAIDGKESDAQKAESYRNKLRPILEQAAAVMNEASKDGLVLGWNVGRDAVGFARVSMIEVVRHL